MSTHSSSPPKNSNSNQSTTSKNNSRPTTGGSESNPFSEQNLSNGGSGNGNGNRNENGTRKSRVHWDGASSRGVRPGTGGSSPGVGVGGGILPSSNNRQQQSTSSAPISRGGLGLGGLAGLLAQQQQQHTGPTVSIRSPSGVTRTNHPGPLQLSTRLDPPPPPSTNNGHSSIPSIGIAPPQENHQTGIDPLSTLDANVALGGARSLDEQGLDDRAFLELRRELQRHEEEKANLEGRGNQVEVTHHHQEQEIDDTPAPKSSRVRRAAGNETPQWGGSTSGASTPGGWTTDSSYDAAADSDLGHIDLISGEIDGMPSKPKKSRRKREEEDEEEQPTGWARVRGLFGNKSNQHDIGDSNDLGQDMAEKGGIPSHEEGGPTNTKALPVTTSSGTRAAAPKSRPSKFEKEAAKLVKAHKIMLGRGGEDSSSGGAINPGLNGPSINRDHLDSGASTPDALDTMASLDARPVQSGGVLGNLLKLYEQQQREQASRSGLSSDAGTSDISTPAEERGDLASLVASELHRERSKENGGRDSPSMKSGTISPSTRRRWMTDSPHAYYKNGGRYAGQAGRHVASGGKTVAVAGGKIVKAVAADAGFDEVVDDRPKASRSAGGTIGGLIATTGK